MYLSNYPEGSAALCQDLIHASPLGLLISGSGPNWSTSLLPFVLQEKNGQPTLVTHLARANPQWQCLEDQSVLVNFVGVEIAVTEINGKFKLSQNRTREEHQIIENHLRESPRPEDNGVAYWMRKVGWT